MLQKTSKELNLNNHVNKLRTAISRGRLEWRPTNSWRCHKSVKPGVNLWSRALIYNRPA